MVPEPRDSRTAPNVGRSAPRPGTGRGRFPASSGAAAALVALGAVLVGTAQARPAETRALVVTGGHDFERTAFEAMLDALGGVEWTAADQGETAEAWDRDDLEEFDVVILYDMVQESTPEQRAAFVSLFERGTGVVVLHHALVAHQRWADYERLVGGRYPEDPERPGRVTEAVGYEHDVEIPLEIATPEHPVVAGIGGFTVHDEIYWGFRVAPDVTPLLTTPHPASGNPVAWARTQGRSRVVAIQPGHGPQAFRNPHYRRLLEQAVRWAAGLLAPRGR